MVTQNSDDHNQKAGWLLRELGELFADKKRQILKSDARTKREFQKDSSACLVSLGATTVVSGIIAVLSANSSQGGLGISIIGMIILIAGVVVKQLTQCRIAALEKDERKSQKDLADLDAKAKLMEHAWLHGLPGIPKEEVLRAILTGELQIVQNLQHEESASQVLTTRNN